jgi:3-hydroxybutyryl-CoA dehydrogenase
MSFPAPVQTIAVIGAGTMGRGIAHAAALGGFHVIIEDILPASLRRAETEIRTALLQSAELGELTREQAETATANIKFASRPEEAARAADLVIEAVPEEMESKLEIFTLLDKTCKPGTMLASSTASLSVTEMASVTYRPRKCVGMHFFLPLRKVKLLEVVRALETDDETLAAVTNVARHMGKEPIVLRESPGFVSGRIEALLSNEAFYMLQEGIASAADIDKAVKLSLNHALGPLEMADFAGLDTRLHQLEDLHRHLGEKYRPAPLLVQYVKAGRLGKKSGRGVYDYPVSS